MSVLKKQPLLLSCMARDIPGEFLQVALGCFQAAKREIQHRFIPRVVPKSGSVGASSGTRAFELRLTWDRLKSKLLAA